jgi:hypothetical protein
MKLNKKMIIMLASVIGVIVVTIIIIMLFVGGGSKKLSYDVIEDKMVAAGESYFLDNEDKLPKEGTDVVDDDTLIEKETSCPCGKCVNSNCEKCEWYLKYYH